MNQILANPLAAYAGGQQLGQQKQVFDRENAVRNMGMLVSAARGVKTPEEFERAKQAIVASGALKAEQVQQYTFDQLPALLNAVRGIEGQISGERDRRNFERGVFEFDEQMGYRNERAAVSDEQWQAQYDRAVGNDKISQQQHSDKLKAAGVAAIGKEAQLNLDNSQKLRKEWIGIPAVKDFSKQSQAYGRVIASAKDPSPAGDLAMIFNFMKVLDPGSVVRESEFATAEAATVWMQESEEAGITVPQPIAAAIRKLATGQRLSPEQRQDFLGRATDLYQEAERGHMGLRGQYEGIAKAGGFDVGTTIPDFRWQQPEQDVPDIAEMSNEQLIQLLESLPE